LNVTEELGLTAVTHLVLHKTYINSAPAFVFPNLITLTLQSVVSLPFSRDAFPSLRAVRVTAGWRHLRFPSELPFSQLDALEVDYEDQEHLPADLLQHGVPVLVHLNLPIVHAPSPAGPPFDTYEHFHVSFDLEADGVEEQLKEFNRLVDGHAALKSVYVPSTISPSRTLPPIVELARTSLLDECAARDVTVLWRRSSSIENDNVGISKEFWEYAKHVKEKKKLEAEEGSSGGSK
jgi:hypothetical protein